jgi:hypothetical protein
MGLRDGMDGEALGEASSFRDFLDVTDDNGYLICTWLGGWQDRLKSVS